MRGPNYMPKCQKCQIICYMPKCLTKYPTDLYEISPVEERSPRIVEFELH